MRAATGRGEAGNLPLTMSWSNGGMSKPDVFQHDEALVAVVATLERFRRALLPLALTSTITLAGMALSALT